MKSTKFCDHRVQWLSYVTIDNYHTKYYTYTRITYPDNKVLYSFRGLWLLNQHTNPREYSSDELINIHEGSNAFSTGTFTDYANTNWDPLGLQALYDVLTIPAPDGFNPNPFAPIPLPIPVPVF